MNRGSNNEIFSITEIAAPRQSKVEYIGQGNSILQRHANDY